MMVIWFILLLIIHHYPIMNKDFLILNLVIFSLFSHLMVQFVSLFILIHHFITFFFFLFLVFFKILSWQFSLTSLRSDCGYEMCNGSRSLKFSEGIIYFLGTFKSGFIKSQNEMLALEENKLLEPISYKERWNSLERPSFSKIGILSFFYVPFKYWEINHCIVIYYNQNY